MRSGFRVVGTAGLVAAGAVALVASAGAGRAPSATPPSLTRSVLPASCRATAPPGVPANPRALTRQQLAPPGASAIRMCRYSGLNAHPRLRLVRSVLRTDASLVGELVGGFDRLPEIPPGAAACPLDDGSEIVSLLAYPDGHAVTVGLGLTGCVIAPVPLISTLGVTRSATLVSYCWTRSRPGGTAIGMCADGTLGHAAHTLRWRPGAPIIIDLRLPGHGVSVQASQIATTAPAMHDVRAVHVRPFNRSGRRVIRLPVGAQRDNDLLVSATFAQGDVTADIGLQELRSG